MFEAMAAFEAAEAAASFWAAKLRSSLVSSGSEKPRYLELKAMSLAKNRSEFWIFQRFC